MKNPNQLSLFDQVFNPSIDEVWTDAVGLKAVSLLDALNDGLKPKDQYAPQVVYLERNFIVLMVANRSKDALFNVLDFDGKTPPEMAANWRNIQHIKQELKQN